MDDREPKSKKKQQKKKFLEEEDFENLSIDPNDSGSGEDYDFKKKKKDKSQKKDDDDIILATVESALQEGEVRKSRIPAALAAAPSRGPLLPAHT